MNIKNKNRGFTLIEILIVVAIIAILASIVIVGLGPAQQSGRDARRVADLQNIRNGLQLYYDKCGFYPGSSNCAAGAPGGSSWSSFQTTLANSGIGIASNGIPSDPSTNRSYAYAYLTSDNSSYLLAASLENPNNAVFTTYKPLDPTTLAKYTWTSDTGGPSTDCNAPTYCISL
jgi:prepilin-type N-terminal cleavage/methylation domain-containing protein